LFRWRDCLYNRETESGERYLAHATPDARSSRPMLSAPGKATARAFLVIVLLAALAVRLWIVATHTYIVFPDETFQYLEPAHRIVFGSGVITWEYLDGIRNWLLPGLLAGVMWLVSRIDPDPRVYVMVLRLLCVFASLSVPFVGFQMAARRFGPVLALLTGLLCAFASEAVYFAPVIMAEPLATDAALLAIWLGDGVRPLSWRRLLAAGLMFGLASSLRFQYAPILGVIALLQYTRRPPDLAVVAAGGIAVVVLALGVLDAATWGAPFQSVWLNYIRNAEQGVSAAMGTQPWFFYIAYYLVAWGAAAGILVGCAILGAVRVPILGAVVLCTIGLHALIPHKELRFVFLATTCMPMLVGAGLGLLLQRVPRLHPTAVGAPIAIVLAVAISSFTAWSTYRHATPGDAWHRDRAMLQATAAARDYPDACGLGIRTIWVYRTGGYTYWNRDLPISKPGGRRRNSRPRRLDCGSGAYWAAGRCPSIQMRRWLRTPTSSMS
jgi:phosphatidylinositol glycan class B